MSSEESGNDDITVHSLPWRSDYVSAMFSKIDSYILIYILSAMFSKIDSYILNHKSAQAKRHNFVHQVQI